MFLELFWIVVYYHIFVWVHTRMQPAYLPVEESRLERSHEVPVKMISMIHAFLTSCYGLLYFFDIITLGQLYDGRALSTAFLMFDFVQAVTFWKRDGDESSLAHPYGVAFHHLVTFFFIYGIMFESSIAGLLAFFLSEIPVVFLNVTWLYFYMGESGSRECAIFSILTIVTYFIFRVILFPLIFFCVLLPKMSLFNPLSPILIILLVLIYVLNCFWFTKLLTKTAKLVPNLYSFPLNSWGKYLCGF